jgi:uncharacterized iron-regulated membrane protein
VESVKAAYPDSRIAGIYAPTATRQTFLVYVSGKQRFPEVLVDPQTAEVLGELPERSFWTWLQDLHFNLLAGSTGRIVNGMGALCVLIMCMTGLAIWWAGSGRWGRALRIDFRNNWKRVNFDLHSAVGFWTLAFSLMWGLTGAYFAWPQQFRAVLNWFSPVSVNTAFTSNPPATVQPPPDAENLIATALASSPEREFWGILFPLSERAPYQITTARILGRNEWDNADHIDFYFDQYNGRLINAHPRVSRSVSDVVVSWIIPAHFGTFGGIGVKFAWLILGLAPSLLFVTGFIMWWNRVVSDRWLKLSRRSGSPAVLVPPDRHATDHSNPEAGRHPEK